MNQPKTIYFIHSTGFDFKREYYGPIQESRLLNFHKLLFPHAESDEPFSSRELFESVQCDLVVAEVSFPSTGGGIELGWANAFGIPIIMVVREASAVSDSLRSLCLAFVRYRDGTDLITKLVPEINKIDNHFLSADR